MPKTNFHRPEWDLDLPEPPFGSRLMRLGARAGGQALGASLCPAGPDGAHRILNAGDEPARVVLVATRHFPDVAEHPDTGTTLAMTGPAEGKALSAAGEVDVMAAVAQAAQIAVDRERAAS